MICLGGPKNQKSQKQLFRWRILISEQNLMAFRYFVKSWVKASFGCHLAESKAIAVYCYMVSDGLLQSAIAQPQTSKFYLVCN
jgi:hypothetical protein